MPHRLRNKNTEGNLFLTGTRYSPWEHSEQIGVQVLYRPFREQRSAWMPSHHTIVLRSGLSYTTEREVLAHALGHAILGHTGNSAEDECEADLCALTNLVDPHEFDHATRHTMNLARISTVLGITPQLLKLYLLKAV
jgi:Zn-dependent peptidase ImmA (M78 family)